MSDKLTTLDWIALVFLIIGGVNWGLIGFFSYDIISAIFGVASVVTRIVFALVGISALYMVAVAFKIADMSTNQDVERRARPAM
ncbi:MAG: hypothetical protein A3I29_04585 [Candidatus Magasanikbacteria bacterium RIFCSPLOWO2_02_FULL_44_11]|uniref:DUF378 domain-containing protein n=2 Tax=Candidatus Magasanikiibacteriota TaxID=1752731 RepID=A0A1F6N9B0_9BACT|nr:MAG: hypothetical protein A3D53_03740 [Candidatus Magasanikbacteria bacterium RIFCSPHIGHO2_02_FULL_45_10]OGH80512.1 MAG: hypothetical protein A3I29_04585 [Candidatus Magasanikbacteria bacterium RIFCSPLOWO2_02_FULL_44_11]